MNSNSNDMMEIEFQSQMILNTGEHHTGIIFPPGEAKWPSAYAEVAVGQTSSAPRHAPISGSSTGWETLPDVGGTNLKKSDAEMPIGSAGVLVLFAALYALWRTFCRKRHVLFILLCSIASVRTQADLTALDFSSAAPIAGQTVAAVPTASSLPDGTLYMCWSMYYDAACEYPVDGVTFSMDPSAGTNAVSFEAPEAGTYYLKSSLYSGALCDGLLESYYVSPLIVYPSDADLVIRRDAQAAALRHDITDDSSLRAYAAMRFSRAVLNDAERSAYERYNYFVSFPFDVQVADIYGIGTVGSHWRILYYDGRGRAEEGFFAERTTNWVMIDDTDSVLHAGQGYLLQLNGSLLTAEHDEVWTNGSDVATLYFPALHPITAITATNETIPALGDAYRCTIDLSASLGAEADRRSKDSYWRCLGVPSLDAPSGVVGLPYLYTWSMADNSLSVVSSADRTFRPTEAYLVQNGDQIVWTGVEKPKYALSARREQTEQFAELRLEVRQGGEEADRTYLRLTNDEATTADFDFGRDLMKELNAGRANIYSLVGYERLAANCMPEADSAIVVPMGLQIAEAGEYTFAMPDGTNGVGVTLVDGESGERTNLALTDYTLTLDAGTYDSRFSLEIQAVSQTGTGLEQTGADSREGVRKAIIDGVLYILRDGQVFDAHGQRVE